MTQSEAVPFSRTASLFLYGLGLSDALLDVRGEGRWLRLLAPDPSRGGVISGRASRSLH